MEARGNMAAPDITPLRKRNGEAELYTRRPNIEANLTELLALSRDEILARCAVHDREDSAYLPSECLLYLIRANRTNSPDVYFETVYKALAERVMSALPLVDNTDFTESTIREESFGRFLELLAKDRVEYVESLDFFEIRFKTFTLK